MKHQDQDQHTQLLLAVVLSLAVLLVWQYFFPPPKPPPSKAPETTVSDQVKPGGSVPSVSDTVIEGAQPTAAGQARSSGAPVADRADAIKLSPRVEIKTESLSGSINLQGGRIDDLTLVKYHQTVDKGSPNVVLFSPADARDAYFAEYGWVAPSASAHKMPGRDTVWSVDGDKTLTAGGTVRLRWDNGSGLVFKRSISLDKDYLFKIDDNVENNSASEVTLYPYARIYRYGTPKIEGFFIQHEGLIGVLGEKGLQELDYAGVRDDGESQTFKDVKGGWVGFTDKYWASALIPDQSTTYTASLKLNRPAQGPLKEDYQADYLLGAKTIAVGATDGVSAHLYAGAKKYDVIQRYEEENKFLQFDLMVDWGWFYFITKPLYSLLSWLYHVFGNFGVAILITTIIVKIIFFPLANKSYESMAKMKKLQPEMEKLRERYKDDKAKQQQEVMALYQREKINPLAGCLPLLLQIPVFFALYKVLFVSIDMRHAPFFGWIQDLSAPDPTSIFNLFGLLPYDVPLFLMIGVWPLLMGITMWLQMQLNPQQPDPTQQMIFNWMPVIFTFMLATFPAGLVIYWAWNNILSIAQQYTIMKRQGTDIPLMDNLKKTYKSIVDLPSMFTGGGGSQDSGKDSDKPGKDKS